MAIFTDAVCEVSSHGSCSIGRDFLLVQLEVYGSDE